MVYADEEDLAIIEEAAKRYGVSEAEIIHSAIHRAAMSSRVWDEPFFSKTYKRLGNEGYEEAKEAVWQAQVDRYRATRSGDSRS